MSADSCLLAVAAISRHFLATTICASTASFSFRRPSELAWKSCCSLSMLNWAKQWVGYSIRQILMFKKSRVAKFFTWFEFEFHFWINFQINQLQWSYSILFFKNTIVFDFSCDINKIKKELKLGKSSKGRMDEKRSNGSCIQLIN